MDGNQRTSACFWLISSVVISPPAGRPWAIQIVEYLGQAAHVSSEVRGQGDVNDLPAERAYFKYALGADCLDELCITISSQ